MATIELFGRVNDKGELEIELPQGLQAGSQVKVTITEPDKPQEGHWGQNLIAHLHTLDTSSWKEMDIEDPVEWLRQQREDEERHRRANWEIE